MLTIIPRHAHTVGRALLAELQKIKTPTDEQRRFIGSLRKALGEQSSNEKRKTGHR